MTRTYVPEKVSDLDYLEHSDSFTQEVDEGKPRRRFVSKYFRDFLGIKEKTEDEETGNEVVGKRKSWFRAKKIVHSPFTVGNQLAAIVFVSWVRVLLILTPVGFAVHYSQSGGPTADFLTNFFAILPLTDMFGQALVEVKIWASDPRLELIASSFAGRSLHCSN
jgi:hypothetical protein